MTGMPNIELIEVRAPKTALERSLLMWLKTLKLNGDFLNDPPDINGAYTYVQNVIKDLEQRTDKNGTVYNPYKYHNSILVEQDQSSVSVVIRGTSTDARRILCRFQKINK